MKRKGAFIVFLLVFCFFYKVQVFASGAYGAAKIAPVVYKSISISAVVIILISSSVLYYLYGTFRHQEYTLVKSENGNLSNTIENSYIKLGMYIKGNNFSSTVNEIPFEIKNTGQSSVKFGNNYTVEIYKEGTWYQIPFKKNIAFAANAIWLNPGGTFTGEISLDILEYTMIKGRYRFVKEFTAKGNKVKLAVKFGIN